MNLILAWVEAHPTTFALVVWPLITAIVTWLFKPRTAADYAKLPPKVAGLLRLIGALGFDVPNVLKALRALFGNAPPAPPALGSSPPPPPKLPIRDDDIPTKPNSLRGAGERRPLLALVLMASLLLPGCAFLKSAAPALDNIITYVEDAQQVIAGIETIVNVFFLAHPAPDAQNEYALVDRKVHESLDVLVRLAHAGKDLSDEDVQEAIKDFQLAYDEFEKLLTAKGVHMPPRGRGTLGAHVSTAPLLCNLPVTP